MNRQFRLGRHSVYKSYTPSSHGFGTLATLRRFDHLVFEWICGTRMDCICPAGPRHHHVTTSIKKEDLYFFICVACSLYNTTNASLACCMLNHRASTQPPHCFCAHTSYQKRERDEKDFRLLSLEFGSSHCSTSFGACLHSLCYCSCICITKGLEEERGVH